MIDHVEVKGDPYYAKQPPHTHQVAPPRKRILYKDIRQKEQPMTRIEQLIMESRNRRALTNAALNRVPVDKKYDVEALLGKASDTYK